MSFFPPPQAEMWPPNPEKNVGSLSPGDARLSQVVSDLHGIRIRGSRKSKCHYIPNKRPQGWIMTTTKKPEEKGLNIKENKCHGTFGKAPFWN